MSDLIIWKTIIDHTTRDEIFIIIDKIAFDQINCFRQNELSQLEACGVIIGERKDKHFFIRKFTPPMPTDNRTRYSCKRNNDGHQELVDQLHLESKGSLQYLGEWHTHPQITARPSTKDKNEWPKTYNYLSKEENMKEMICLILGTDSDWLGIYHQDILYSASIMNNIHMIEYQENQTEYLENR